jgi:hypothetical protein
MYTDVGGQRIDPQYYPDEPAAHKEPRQRTQCQGPDGKFCRRLSEQCRGYSIRNLGRLDAYPLSLKKVSISDGYRLQPQSKLATFGNVLYSIWKRPMKTNAHGIVRPIVLRLGISLPSSPSYEYHHHSTANNCTTLSWTRPDLHLTNHALHILIHE